MVYSPATGGDSSPRPSSLHEQQVRRQTSHPLRLTACQPPGPDLCRQRPDPSQGFSPSTASPVLGASWCGLIRCLFASARRTPHGAVRTSLHQRTPLPEPGEPVGSANYSGRLVPPDEDDPTTTPVSGQPCSAARRQEDLHDMSFQVVAMRTGVGWGRNVCPQVMWTRPGGAVDRASKSPIQLQRRCDKASRLWILDDPRAASCCGTHARQMPAGQGFARASCGKALSHAVSRG